MGRTSYTIFVSGNRDFFIDIALVAHDQPHERQADINVELKSPVFLAFVRVAPWSEPQWQSHAQHAPAPDRHTQAVILDDRREPERERAEALAQESFVRSAPLVLHAGESSPGEVSSPGLTTALTMKLDCDANIVAGLWKAKQCANKFCERITGARDPRTASPLPGRCISVNSAHRVGQIQPGISEHPLIQTVGGIRRIETHIVFEPQAIEKAIKVFHFQFSGCGSGTRDRYPAVVAAMDNCRSGHRGHIRPARTVSDEIPGTLDACCRRPPA